MRINESGRHRGRSYDSDPLAYLVKDAVMTSQEGTRDNLGPQDRVIECVDCWKQFVFTDGEARWFQANGY